MRYMKHMVCVILLLAGCSDSTGPACEWRELTVDVIYYTAEAVVQMELVASLQEDGWLCSSTFLYNAAGEAVGRQYVCRICD